MIRFVCLIFILVFASCQSKEHYTYMYADKDNFVSCENSEYLNLIKDAYYEFENATITYSANEIPNSKRDISPELALRAFTSRAIQTPDIKKYITINSVAIFKELKDLDLWYNGKINVQSEVLTCLIDNIENDDTKTTLNALRKSESLTHNLVYKTVYNSRSLAQFKDKSLMSLVAFYFYYSKFFQTDFSEINYLKKINKEDAVKN